MAERVAPIVNSLSLPFWEAAEAGRLVLPFCRSSGRFFWPPAPSSPFVTGGPVEWREAEPEGIVRSLVVFRRGFQRRLNDRLPYAVALVELQPQLRLPAHVEQPERPGAPGVGERVRLLFRPLAEGEPPVPFAVPLRREEARDG